LGLEPDVVLIDVLMPGFGKADLERLLRHYPAGSASPVILHSSLPISTLRRMVKVSSALGIVRATQNDDEFVRNFTSFIGHLQLRDRLRQTPMSGMHRISSEAQDVIVEDEITQDGSTRRR
jgi:CheY-like chemotaxis protein